jgi:hypothetical protein
MDGFIFRYFLVKDIGVHYRAVFYTGSTTRTFVLNNVAGLFNQRYFEVSRFPLYSFNFGIGKNFYIGMPADLDQFRREYSDGAFIGRKGLIQLGHMAADGRRSVNQVNFKTGRSQIQGGLNTADSSADNHYITKITAGKSFNELSFHSFQFFFHLSITSSGFVCPLPAG